MDEKYFIAKLYYEFPDEETGKVKKVKEEKLVKAYNPTDVEAKITKRYSELTWDWRITSIAESKIDEVIEVL